MYGLIFAIFELLEYMIKYRKHPICKHAYLKQVEKKHTEIARNSFSGGVYYREVGDSYLWACKLAKYECDNIKNYECARYEVGDSK